MNNQQNDAERPDNESERLDGVTGGERGNTKHGPILDDQMEQESRGMVQGHGPAHAEPFRQTEPLPDDTDAEDVVQAFDVDSVGEKRPSEVEDDEL